MDLIVGILIFLFIFIVIKFSRKSEEKRWEVERNEIRLKELEALTKRQEALLTGLCPQCHKEKAESLVCSNCGFKFIDGHNCNICGEFFPTERLQYFRNMDLNWIYECASCFKKTKGRY
ncbi:hypothetical protein [Bacillus sp. UNC438CL73TsuS30]|uniref:hypothetical protein n=1 Tax=Bacillus sp. UNC438CL73TsuS30 TaxID=1340434 RepID=UPI0018CC71A5|nr:hypothetical protein [Bacillus sp. UNC438CL73TsuS30]